MGSSQGNKGIPIFDGIGRVQTQYSSGSFSYCNKANLTNFRPSVIVNNNYDYLYILIKRNESINKLIYCIVNI